MTCPDCNGKKKRVGFTTTADGCGYSELDCFRCHGKGEVPDEMAEWMRLGQQLADDRVRRRLTLREEAQRLGVAMLTLGHAERGYIDPSPIVTQAAGATQ